MNDKIQNDLPMEDDIQDLDPTDVTAHFFVEERSARLAFAGEVWNRLSRIDVGDNIDTVQGTGFQFSYLSWSWGWATLMKNYPASSYTVLEEERFDDGTVNVRIVLTVADFLGNTLDRFSWLPVMDRRNNAIQNPNARDINDARMRCLVKAMAFCGMGLDLWTGGDIPVGATEDPISPDQVELLNGLIEKAKPDMLRFLKWMKVDTVEEIPLSKFRQAQSELERKIRSMK